MPSRFLSTWFVLCVLACMSIAHAQTPETRNLGVAPAGKRIALVIGNDNYQKVSKLQKAGNDATAMARELRAAGFEVLLHRDLDYRGMVKAVETLSNSITGGDQVVVFFAGHGVQIKTGSYLLPIDIEANSESEVEKTSYGLADLTDKLSEARASFALVMVDACRNNPLKSKGRSIGATRGLSAIEPPKGQMVVYSASKGQQALDRLDEADNHPNGVFTREFIARMKRPGVRIEDMMREVQDAVEELARSVSHDQRPAIYNESRGNFYFFGPTTVQVQTSPLPPVVAPAKPVALPPATPIVTAKPEDAETAMWNEVKASGAREHFEAYLQQYAKGKYAALAKIELKKLDDRDKAARAREEAERKQAVAREAEERRQSAALAAAEQARAEQSAWDQAKAGDSLATYLGYLEAYPQGRYASLAKAAQQKLEREARDREKQEAARRQREQTEAVVREEAQHWQRAQNAGDSATVQGYLDRYPSGRYVSEARLKLAAVKKEEAEMRPGKAFKDCADCPEMVMVPAGSFEMGGTGSDEKPAHRVTLKGFALGRTEVTQGQWRSVMGSNPSSFSSCGDDCPVEQVSWNDAQEYVKKLSQKTGKSYRLPSEAEWEYACRAGGQHTYCGGDNVDSVAWNTNSSGSKTHAVAGKQANAWGLYDMSGNVWEWTEDCWNGNYSGAPSDGSAWTSGNCSERVLRGGSWGGLPQDLRSALRVRFTAGLRYYYLGFRLARTPF